MKSPVWNAPVLFKSHEKARLVSFHRFGLQPSEGARQIPIWNRVPFNLCLVVWSRDLPEVLMVELWVEAGHRVVWHRLSLDTARPVLRASKMFGQTKWSDLAIVHHAISMSRRGPPYQGVGRHFVSVHYQTFVEELAAHITAPDAPEQPMQIPFDTSSTECITAEKRWMQGMPPFAILHGASGTDWMGGLLFSVPAGPDGSTGGHPFHGERRIAYPELRGPGAGFELGFKVDMPNHLRKLIVSPVDDASQLDFRPTAYAFTKEATASWAGPDIDQPDIIDPDPKTCLVNAHSTHDPELLVVQDASTGRWGVTFASRIFRIGFV
ncbi:hypothetical protein B0H10DRAFT_2128995 [Mycena sp. CBHHK59/15]|nr:hypothetical protein B0H10DRAFT_2128995 [Mycena sp. CBHHK59/15]